MKFTFLVWRGWEELEIANWSNHQSYMNMTVDRPVTSAPRKDDQWTFREQCGSRNTNRGRPRRRHLASGASSRPPARWQPLPPRAEAGGRRRAWQRAPVGRTRWSSRRGTMTGTPGRQMTLMTRNTKMLISHYCTRARDYSEVLQPFQNVIVLTILDRHCLLD